MSFWHTVLNEEVLGREGKGGGRQEDGKSGISGVKKSPFPYNLIHLSIQNRLTRAVPKDHLLR